VDFLHLLHLALRVVAQMVAASRKHRLWEQLPHRRHHCGLLQCVGDQEDQQVLEVPVEALTVVEMQDAEPEVEVLAVDQQQARHYPVPEVVVALLVRLFLLAHRWECFAALTVKMAVMVLNAVEATPVPDSRQSVEEASQMEAPKLDQRALFVRMSLEIQARAKSPACL